MRNSNEVCEDAKKYNAEYNHFEVCFYDGESKTFAKYGTAYQYAARRVRSGRPCSIVGVKYDWHIGGKDERDELIAC